MSWRSHAPHGRVPRHRSDRPNVYQRRRESAAQRGAAISSRDSCRVQSFSQIVPEVSYLAAVGGKGPRGPAPRRGHQLARQLPRAKLLSDRVRSVLLGRCRRQGPKGPRAEARPSARATVAACNASLRSCQKCLTYQTGFSSTCFFLPSDSLITPSCVRSAVVNSILSSVTTWLLTRKPPPLT